MSEQKSPTTRQALLEAWYDQLHQADGTYLLRPYFPFSLTYKVDVATKERWMRFHLRYPRTAVPAALLVIGAMVGGGFLRDDDAFFLRASLAFLLLSVANVMAVYAAARVIFRHAQRVSPAQWKRPASVIGPEVMPRSRLGILASVGLAGVAAVFLAGSIFTIWIGPAETFWPTVQGALFFGALLLTAVLGMLRGRPAAMIRDAVMVLFIA